MMTKTISAKVPKETRTARAFFDKVATFEDKALKPFKGVPSLQGFRYTLLDSSENIRSGNEGGPIGANGYFNKGFVSWANDISNVCSADIMGRLVNAGAIFNPPGKTEKGEPLLFTEAQARDFFRFKSELIADGTSTIFDDTGREFMIRNDGGSFNAYRRDVKGQHVDIVNSALMNMFAATGAQEMACGVCKFENSRAGTVYIFAGRLGNEDPKWGFSEFNLAKLRGGKDSFALVVGIGDGISGYANGAAHFIQNMGIPALSADNKIWGKRARQTPDDIFNRLNGQISSLLVELQQLKEENGELRYGPALNVRHLCGKVEQEILPLFKGQRKVRRELAEYLKRIENELKRIGREMA